MLEGPRASVQANKGAYLLLGASLVVLIASAKLCDTLNTCKDELAWAVACSAVSLGFTFFFCIAALLKQGLADAGAPYLSAFLAIWWFPGAFVLTFDGPFVSLANANGYFGSWASLIFALMWFAEAGAPKFGLGGGEHKEAPAAGV